MASTITSNGISSAARHIFHVLKDFARGKNWPECWPHLWRIVEESGKSRRTVLYSLRELELAGAIQIDRVAGKGSVYRILLAINDKIGELPSCCTGATIALVPVQPIALVPVQPIALVDDLHPYKEEASTASSAVTDVPAAAAEEIFLGEEMISTSRLAFDDLVKLGMPANEELARFVEANPDFARDALRHCKRRFGNRKKPVQNTGGYIVALLRDPGKFGFLLREGVWIDSERPSGETGDDIKAKEMARKAAWKKDSLERQAKAEESYADMKRVWENLPETAKQEISEFVVQNSPLFHDSGRDVAEFELACMNEATSLGRTNWLRRHRGLPPVKGAVFSARG